MLRKHSFSHHDDTKDDTSSVDSSDHSNSYDASTITSASGVSALLTNVRRISKKYQTPKRNKDTASHASHSSAGSASIFRYLGLDHIPSRMGQQWKMETSKSVLQGNQQRGLSILNTIARSNSFVQRQQQEQQRMEEGRMKRVWGSSGMRIEGGLDRSGVARESGGSIAILFSMLRYFHPRRNPKFILVFSCFLFLRLLRQRESLSTYHSPSYSESTVENKSVLINHVNDETTSGIPQSLMEELDSEAKLKIPDTTTSTTITAASPIVEIDNEVPSEMFFPSTTKNKRKIDPKDILTQFQEESHVLGIIPDSQTEAITTQGREDDNDDDTGEDDEYDDNKEEEEEENKLNPIDIINQFQFGNNGKTPLLPKRTKKKYNPSDIIQQFQNPNQAHYEITNNNPEESLAMAVQKELGTTTQGMESTNPNNIISDHHTKPSKPKTKYNPSQIIHQFPPGSSSTLLGDTDDDDEEDEYEDANNDREMFLPEQVESTEPMLRPNDIINQFQFGNDGKHQIPKPTKKYDPSNIIRQFQPGIPSIPDATKVEVEDKSLSIAEAVQAELLHPREQERETNKDDDDDDNYDDVEDEEEFNVGLDPQDIINQFQFGNDGKTNLQKATKKFDPSMVINQKWE